MPVGRYPFVHSPRLFFPAGALRVQVGLNAGTRPVSFSHILPDISVYSHSSCHLEISWLLLVAFECSES